MEPLPRQVILIVDDSPPIREALGDLLGERYRVETAADGAAARAFLAVNVPDLVLLDMILPDANGHELCQEIKANERLADVPVILVTSIDDPAEMAKSFSLGAVDYITKPVKPLELTARVNLHLGLKQARESLAQQNALLEQKVQQRTEKLEQVLGMSLLLNSERDVEQMFQRIVAGVSHILECDRSSLFLLDPGKGHLWTKVAEGLTRTITVPVGKGLVGKTAASGEPSIIEDTTKSPDFDGSWDLKHGYHTRNILCYPVRNRANELRGVLQAINKRDGAFGAEDGRLAAALSAQIGVALETGELLEELRGAFESFARTLSRAVEAKHTLTAGHAVRVTEYSLLLGRRIGLSEGELEIVKYAGLLHDIGKIGVPDHVLTKSGQFDPDERALMQTHTRWTSLILGEISLPKNLRDVPWIATCHHERVDGAGYPSGLRGKGIPFLSRIIAISDVFDALTSRRDYSKYDGAAVFSSDPLPLDQAFEILRRDRGTQFDEEIVETALAARDDLTDSWLLLTKQQEREQE
jgi:response regulator RpfG family c-di-GMP phosphodiesterase